MLLGASKFAFMNKWHRGPPQIFSTWYTRAVEACHRLPGSFLEALRATSLMKFNITSLPSSEPLAYALFKSSVICRIWPRFAASLTLSRNDLLLTRQAARLLVACHSFNLCKLKPSLVCRQFLSKSSYERLRRLFLSATSGSVLTPSCSLQWCRITRLRTS